MAGTHVSFATLFDHLAGFERAHVSRHLQDCPACAARAERANSLLAAGRRALRAPRPSRRNLSRALRIFREHHSASQPSVLQLVLDSLLRPAPALRGAAAATPTRFLCYEGAVTVELQVTPVRGRVELRGQITPPDFAAEVQLVHGTQKRRARVAPDGTFLWRAVPHGEVEIWIGTVRLHGLDL
jgi:anti-sigma factor RsiW